MPILNARSTTSTAWLRAAGSALLALAGTFLMTYGQTDDLKSSLIVAGTAATIALGWRGGVEGMSDALRDAHGDVKSGDVGQPNQP